MKSRKVLLGLFVSVCMCFAGTAAAQKSNKLVEIGPDNIGGRVTSVVVFSNNEGQAPVLFAGAASGGLYTKSNGSYWSYVPCTVGGNELILPVSSLMKANDSILVVGTGESAYQKGSNIKAMGALGRGVYLFNVITKEFTLISSTDPQGRLDADFSAVNDMACMTVAGTTYFYIATAKGLFRWTIDGASSWNNAPVKVFDGEVRDIEVSGQFNMAYFSSKGNLYRIGNVINSATPVNITGTCEAFGENCSGIEIAIAPSDQSYVYALAYDANGLMSGLYLTRDQNSWILLTSTTVTPFSSLATGKNCGAMIVDPYNPAKIYVGGANLWIGQGYVENSPFQWTATSSNESLNSGDYMASVFSNPSFVHSGINQITPVIIWDEEEHVNHYYRYLIATNGGVFYATTDFSAFENFNRGMNNVQINDVAVTPDGSLISGAHSNGCPFIESRMAHHGGIFDTTWYDADASNTNHMANILWYGNGGGVAASQFSQFAPLSRRNIFVSSQSGAYGRAYSDYSNYTNTQTWTSNQDFSSNIVVNGPAVSQVYLWETDKNTTVNDSLTFIIDTLAFVTRGDEKIRLSQDLTVQPGDKITVLDPAHASYPFVHTFDRSFKVGDELRQKVQNPYLSRMLLVTVPAQSDSILTVTYTWYPTDFRKVFDAGTSGSDSYTGLLWGHIYGVNRAAYPHWYVRYAAMSKDGDCAFITVDNDTLGRSFIARVHNFNSLDYSGLMREVRDQVDYTSTAKSTVCDTMWASASDMLFNRRISSIAVDPREGTDNIVITFDGYENNSANVIYIANASSDNYTITEIPVPGNAPVYSSLIEFTTGAIYVGTEEGVFMTTSATSPNWKSVGSFKGVPVTSICQQTSNYKLIRYTGHDGVSEEEYIFPKTKWPYAIYFGTYGRGIFMDSTYVVDHENEITDPSDYLDIPTVNAIGNNSVRIYPNPAVENATMELNVLTAGNAVVRVYDLSGKVVYSENMGHVSEGTHSRALNCQNLRKGMYLVNVVVGNQKATSKLIVR